MPLPLTKKEYLPPKLAITAWAEEDRPREKLILKGRQQLSDAELIAILLGSGSQKESAVALAQRILHAVDRNLQQLGKQSRSELLNFHGVGDAKAIRIIAAMELGRRRKYSSTSERQQLRSSQDAYQCLSPLLAELDHEECWMLCLSRSNHIMQRVKISSGGRAGTVVDAKLIFERALEFKSSAIVLAHNHPSNNLQPSTADRQLTHKLSKAGKTLDLPLLDHLIITDCAYYSFADEGELEGA